ncbi:MAG: rhodanese-like domain-containing protein [Gammaproteobacteria bacterium]|nr:MAG: rhodanese-like domain-containing protein [Gammaproteobacteria bacterium]
MKSFRHALVLLLLSSLPAWADPVWIDVRSQAEFDSGHVAGALLMPHTDIAGLIEQAVPDKDADIHLYCRSGRRAQAALETLQSMGYTKVRNEGGYEQAQQVATCLVPAADGTVPSC